MNKNKLILNHCKNYYSIKDFEYDEEDFITSKLISIYEEYVFNIDESNDEDIKKIEKLDKILEKYISDYDFRKSIKDGVLKIRVKKNCDILEAIVEALFNLFENYEEGYTRNIYFARWI